MKVHELRDRLHSEPPNRQVVMYDAFGLPHPVKVILLDRTIGDYAEGDTLVLVPDFEKSARGDPALERTMREKRRR
jgi:hypothetical protein